MLAKIQSLITLSSISALLASSVCSQLAAADSKPYIAPDFTKTKPVKLEVRQQGGRTGQYLVYATNEGVEIEMIQGGGRVILQWGHMDQFQIYMPMTKHMEDALAHPLASERKRLLKLELDPVLPMSSLEEGTTNIHNLIEAYIEAVVDVEDWLEGYEISQKMALDRTPVTIIQNFYSIAVNLFVAGEHKKALNLLDQLVAARPASESGKESLIVAQSLLSLRLFEPSYSLYRAIASSGDETQAKEALYICAYLSMELGNGESAQYLKKAQAIPDESNATLGTSEIVLGVQAFQQGDSALALKHLGHGLALVKPTSHIRQIGLHYNFLSYENLENEEISTSILDEMKLFFPDGAFTAKLTTQTETL